jgi:hypothetical protein
MRPGVGIDEGYSRSRFRTNVESGWKKSASVVVRNRHVFRCRKKFAVKREVAHKRNQRISPSRFTKDPLVDRPLQLPRFNIR